MCPLIDGVNRNDKLHSMKAILFSQISMKRLLVILFSVICIAAGLTGPTLAQQRHVLVLEIDGIVHPISEGFIKRGVEKAKSDGAELIVIELDTPGGLLNSTRDITQHLLEAELPSVVYVSPRGAQAASAGTFIASAANFSAMSPGTNIGAASPVSATGEELTDTQKSKVFNDAAAEMRSIANLRGRNTEKLEATVLRSLSYTASEALEENIIDLIASDLDDLLFKLDGLQTIIQPPDGPQVTIETTGANIRRLDMSLVEKLLNFLADPNISFLLLTLGGIGLIAELYNPGNFYPGVTGVILLVLAWVSLGNLPVNWAGVVLIIFAIALGTLEIYVTGFGVLGVGAIISFCIGGLLLFFHTGTGSPMSQMPISVSLWVLIPVVSTIGLTVGVLSWFAYKSRDGKYDSDVVPTVGEIATVDSDLNPKGTVHARNELWTAISEEEGDRITIGTRVKVIKVDGIELTVSRL